MRVMRVMRVMRLSRESLLREADTTGFRPEVLEKVFLMLDLLEALNAHSRLVRGEYTC